VLTRVAEALIVDKTINNYDLWVLSPECYIKINKKQMKLDMNRIILLTTNRMI